MARRGPKLGEFDEPKQQRTRERLARILEETDRLFAERGYEATKIADIAAAVPCSISTIYDRGVPDVVRGVCLRARGHLTPRAGSVRVRLGMRPALLLY